MSILIHVKHMMMFCIYILYLNVLCQVNFYLTFILLFVIIIKFK